MRCLPVTNRSASTDFRTEAPDPAQTAIVLILDVNVLSQPSATLTCCSLVHSFTRLITISMLKLESGFVQMRPAPVLGFSAFGDIGCPTPKNSINQSLTPPSTASQAVWGEYRAIRFSRHWETIRSFHELKLRLTIIGKVKTSFIC